MPVTSGDQIFPDGVDVSKLKRVSPGHWEDEASGNVFATGIDFLPPAGEPEGQHEPEGHDAGFIVTEINKLTDEQLHADAADRRIDGQETLERTALIDALLLNAGYTFNHAGEPVTPEHLTGADLFPVITHNADGTTSVAS